jgi:hypothetical protein
MKTTQRLLLSVKRRRALFFASLFLNKRILLLRSALSGGVVTFFWLRSIVLCYPNDGTHPTISFCHTARWKSHAIFFRHHHHWHISSQNRPFSNLDKVSLFDIDAVDLFSNPYTHSKDDDDRAQLSDWCSNMNWCCCRSFIIHTVRELNRPVTGISRGTKEFNHNDQ